MKEIGRAIRRLGAQDLKQRITVHGPRDVQELGELLNWLRQRIQQLEQQKMAFLRHISHELKTPLTTIRSGSELLVEGLNDSSEENAEIARIIHANGLQLQHLIEDLLRFSETQNVGSDLDVVDAVDLESVVRGVLASQALTSTAKDIAVLADLEAVQVRGDPNRLRIVIDNLLTNATKYTPRGGRIRVSLRAAGSCAVLDVEDSGPGVDESETERIFEPFQQGSAEYRASVKGTGLGLSIAKEYVEAHDGHIRVVGSSAGAHFRVSVPIGGPQGVSQVPSDRVADSVLVGV
jgi:two-component system sensor histidine kinase GlrK